MFTEKEKKFLKNNSIILSEIFSKWLEHYREKLEDLDPLAPDYSSKSSLLLLFIKEYKEWIKAMVELSSEKVSNKTEKNQYV